MQCDGHILTNIHSKNDTEFFSLKVTQCSIELIKMENGVQMKFQFFPHLKKLLLNNKETETSLLKGFYSALKETLAQSKRDTLSVFDFTKPVLEKGGMNG